MQSFKGQSPTQSPLNLLSKNSTQQTTNQHSKSRYPDLNDETHQMILDQSFKSNPQTIKKNFNGVFNNSGLELLSQKKKDKQYFASYGSGVSRIIA